MNRVKWAFLTVVLALSLGVAPVWSAGQSEEADEKTTESAEKKTLTVWATQTGDSDMAVIMQNAADSFMKDYPNVSVDIVQMNADAFKTKLKVAMGGGTPPDIFKTWGGGVLKAYIDAGQIEPLNDIKDALLKTYIPASFDPVTFDGKAYGAAVSGLTGVFFWYRMDIFEKYGLKVPTTMKEFYEVSDTLLENGITPIALGNKTKWPGSFYYMYLADRIGGSSLFTDVLYGSSKFTDPAYIKAGEMLYDMVERGYFPNGFNGMDYLSGQSRSLVYSGKAAMILMGSWFYGAALSEAPKEISDNIGMFRFPAVSDGKGDPTNLIGSPGQDYFAVAQVSETKEMAKIFIRDYIMDENYIQSMADESGAVPPVKNASAYVDGRINKKTARFFEEANSVQLYYDQFLPPELGEIHKDLVQRLFAGELTSEEVAQRHQKAFEEYYDSQ